MTLSQLFPCLHYLVSRLASLETKCRMMQTLLALNTLFLEGLAISGYVEVPS